MRLKTFRSFKLILLKAFLFGIICWPLYGQKSNDVLIDSFQVLIDKEGVVEYLKISDSKNLDYFLSRYQAQPRRIALTGIELIGLSRGSNAHDRMNRLVSFLKEHAGNLSYFEIRGPLESKFEAEEIRKLVGVLSILPIKQLKWENMPQSYFKGKESVWKEFQIMAAKIPIVSLERTELDDVQSLITQTVWDSVQELNLNYTNLNSNLFHLMNDSCFPHLVNLSTSEIRVTPKTKLNPNFPKLKTWTLTQIKYDLDTYCSDFYKAYESTMRSCSNLFLQLRSDGGFFSMTNDRDVIPFVVARRDTLLWHNAISKINHLNGSKLAKTGYFSRAYKLQRGMQVPNTGTFGWILLNDDDIKAFLSIPDFGLITEITLSGKLGVCDAEILLSKAAHITRLYILNADIQSTEIEILRRSYPMVQIILIQSELLSPENALYNPGMDWYMQQQMKQLMTPNIPNMPKIHR
ncbi:hypothetical protein L6Q79_10805 [bacterium]|nr:hypothetical protein [bacterium]NUN47163.1 hypothetical protein [bacterium]